MSGTSFKQPSPLGQETSDPILHNLNDVAEGSSLQHLLVGFVDANLGKSDIRIGIKHTYNKYNM